ncbi:hypothetical protein MAR_005162 [Mya arenaria]|uniref:Uncharacterized protein n=1 Tax=Mya arenaria TaxID=6604 RepID=A0ABY7F1U5_MYAAR|nr:hypothetical protein MAR_005162 [Mya arenaria]
MDTPRGKKSDNMHLFNRFKTNICEYSWQLQGSAVLYWFLFIPIAKRCGIFQILKIGSWMGLRKSWLSLTVLVPVRVMHRQ